MLNFRVEVKLKSIKMSMKKSKQLNFEVKTGKNEPNSAHKAQKLWSKID